MRIQGQPYGNLDTTWVDGFAIDRHGRRRPYVGITTMNGMIIDYVWLYPDPGWPGGSAIYGTEQTKNWSLISIGFVLGAATVFFLSQSIKRR